MEPSDCEHVTLGLIFLKHISEGFEAKRAQLPAVDPEGAEDEDEDRADNIFWVPKLAHSSLLQAIAKAHGRGCACWRSASCASTASLPTIRMKQCKPCSRRPN